MAADLAKLLLDRPELRAGEALPFYLRPPDVTPGRGNRYVENTGGSTTHG
jgi:hypothetical protein